MCNWSDKATGEEAKYNTGVGKEWLEAHNWICDSDKLKKLLDKHTGTNVVVVGIASNQEEYLHYFKKAFLLHCNEKTFLHRINTRDEGNNFAKDKSEQEHILSWYLDFQNRMLGLNLIPVDTDKPLQAVVEKVLKEIDSLT